MITSKVTIRHIARVLGRFSSCLLAVPLGRLHYRALERFKIEALKEHKANPARIYLLKVNNRNTRTGNLAAGNFDKIVIILKPGLDDILWWKANIPSSFVPIVRENTSLRINADASSFGWGACTEKRWTGGQFNLEERELHTDILELKAILYGLRSLCDSVKDSHILLQIDNTSAVAVINKMGSTQSSDMDHVVHEIWH